MICQHKHGDMIDGDWICGQCFAKLAERPRRYIWVEGVRGAEGSGRQEVILCPISKDDASGMTLGEFVAASARHVAALTAGHLSGSEAISYIIDLLRLLGEEFGNNDFDWSLAGGRELIADDMQHWDAPSALSQEGGAT